MTLPFDPHELDPEEYGEARTTLETDHESAIERVREACLDEGFGVPVEFSPSELLNEKVDREARSASGSRTQSDDADRDPYYVLGACNPQMANRALDATDERIGALFPCNMIIREVEPGTQEVYHVSIMKIARLLGLPTDDEEMDAIIGDTGEMVDAVFAELEE
ncbi:hypothetical protein CK500_01260 [Halorubrum salipaludis]|uniref:DUF302 domain-containing protein n=1 Tax=Halorubrum salipaludis TaxID=2032630 RepID=A0A2A2FIP5_9EURY|nr:DUF302 domain-containing protein [Halorubrum salipaludis]PAU85326.1 hypothetical protein CK500_01260 [Halorubrum salipaludis]